ncbi:MAG: DUF2723 domain-containing protein, partial [Chloroflexota bacterium]
MNAIYSKPSLPRINWPAWLVSAFTGWPLALSLILGAYLSRVIAETTQGGVRLRVLLPIGLVSMVAAVGLVWLARRIGRNWPVALLIVYVLWPTTDPTLAAWVGLGAVAVLWTLRYRRRANGAWLELGVLLGALWLYVSTLAPSVLPADSGEFQLVSGVLGIAHPPGSPLYTLLGGLFAR